MLYPTVEPLSAIAEYTCKTHAGVPVLTRIPPFAANQLLLSP